MQTLGINYLGMCQHQNPPKIFGVGVLEFRHSFGFRNLGFRLVLDLDFWQLWFLIVLALGFGCLGTLRHSAKLAIVSIIFSV